MGVTYKVLLVEKQQAMIRIYKNMLPWEKYSFEITTVTDNEDRAIAYYGEYHHDLIICDLQLNGGDGLSLIQNLKGLDPSCCIVVISNLDDYDDIRQAFLNGVDDYLLKSSLKHSELGELLKRIKKKLDQRNTQNQNSWREQLEALLGLVRDHQKVDNNVIKDALNHSYLDLLDNDYQMVYFRLDNVRQINRNLREYGKSSEVNKEEFVQMFQNKLKMREDMQKHTGEIIHEIFSLQGEYRLIYTKKHSGLIIVPPSDSTMMKKKMELFAHTLKAVIGYDYSMVYGNVHHGRESFLQAYHELMQYHDWKFYFGDHSILVEDLAHKFQKLDDTAISYHYQLIKAVEKLDETAIQEILEEIYHYMETNCIDPNDVKAYMCMIFDLLETYTEGKGLKNEDQYRQFRSGVKEAETLAFLKQEMQRIFETFIAYLKTNHINKYTKNVNEIILYIQNNLHRKITLAMISNAVGLSEIHASRIFKKEVGMGIVEYINDKKMDVAMELLKNPDLKIKDVALSIGIQDQLYFNKLFKKRFEVSPSEYRKQWF